MCVHAREFDRVHVHVHAHVSVVIFTRMAAASPRQLDAALEQTRIQMWRFARLLVDNQEATGTDGEWRAFCQQLQVFASVATELRLRIERQLLTPAAGEAQTGAGVS